MPLEEKHLLTVPQHWHRWGQLVWAGSVGSVVVDQRDGHYSLTEGEGERKHIAIDC